MLTDAHCHPWDLFTQFPEAEDAYRRLGPAGPACAASAWNPEQFQYHEALAGKAGDPPLLRCFAVHPQLPASAPRARLEELLTYLGGLAAEGRLDAVGETGFDLYDERFKGTEALQEELFRVHLETALNRGLPLVLHVRRAMHKVFAYTKKLRSLPALIFHSWPGTRFEGESLLKRGINAYFSFGSALLLNHKEAMRCCAVFPADRLLLETDAPYQPLRNRAYSHGEDLPLLLKQAAVLRREAGGAEGERELEQSIEENFFRSFGQRRV
ncbi:MAG: TatD family hydrolase [Treponema sp.]|jgi:TatD DNase family protein|nr:TatD family hydrolase [Treponema sp.]